jgi:hypothetical protein
MQRFLLFDSGCAVCSSVAEQVEQDAGGWLQVRDLNDPEMRQLLDQHYPTRVFRPTLVVVDGEKARMFTGPALSVRLVAGIGMRRAARIARHIVGMTARHPEDGVSRRSLLKAASTGAVALFGLSFKPAAGAATAEGDDLLFGRQLDSVGRAAQASPGFRTALAYVKAGGFDTARPAATLAFKSEGATVVLTLFNSVALPETEAALVAHQFGAGAPRTITEFITADRSALNNSDRLTMDAFTVRSINPGCTGPRF